MTDREDCFGALDVIDRGETQPGGTAKLMEALPLATMKRSLSPTVNRRSAMRTNHCQPRACVIGFLVAELVAFSSVLPAQLVYPGSDPGPARILLAGAGITASPHRTRESLIENTN